MSDTRPTAQAITNRLPEGLKILADPSIPKDQAPTPGEDARRIVRHGLADILEWLGEEVGPKPGALTTSIYIFNGYAIMHPESAAKITGAIL